MSYTRLNIPIVTFESLQPGSLIRFDQTVSSRADKPVSAKPSSRATPRLLGERNILRIRVPKFPSASSRKRAAHCCRAVCAAWVAIWPQSQWGLQANIGNWQALRPLAMLLKWIISSYASRGEPFVASRLKGFASWLRYMASDCQLWPAPKPLDRMPLITSSGRPDLHRLFSGSITEKAGRAEVLLRLSRYSRALPPGGEREAVEAQALHKELLRRPPMPLPGLSKELGLEVARVVSRARLDDISRPGFALSSSACFELSSKHGGARTFLREVLWEKRSLRVPFSYQTMFALPMERPRGSAMDWFPPLMEGFPDDIPRMNFAMHSCAIREAFGAHSGLHAQTLSPLVAPPVVPKQSAKRQLAPKHRVVVIPDRGGFKVRVVTVGPAALQSLAHVVRRSVYTEVLPKTPTRHILRDGGLREFFEGLELPDLNPVLGDWVALSCDLKSATDLIPHSLIEAINDSIEQKLSQDQRESHNWLAWRSLSGPQTVHYKDGETFETSSGNLMGTAPSWALLNLFNMSLFRLAWRLWTEPMFRDIPGMGWLRLVRTKADLEDGAYWNFLRSTVESFLDCPDRGPIGPYSGPHPFSNYVAIIGDDLGALCPFAVAVIYEILIEVSGGLSSPGKHYVQPWKRGAFLLIAEESAIVTGNGARFVPTESLRLLATDRVERASALSTTPSWARFGHSLSEWVRGARPSVKRAFCSFGHRASAGLKRRLLQVGLPVYLPVQLGGLGWLHPLGLSYALERTTWLSLRAYQAARGYRQDPTKFVTVLASLRACWQAEDSEDFAEYLGLLRDYLSTLRVSRDLDGKMTELTLESPLGLPAPGIESIPVWEFLDDIAMRGSATRFLAYPWRHRQYIDHLNQLPVGACVASTRRGSGSTPSSEPPSRRLATRVTIGLAARRYKRRSEALWQRREGHLVPLRKKRDAFHLVQQDLHLLDTFHIHVGSVVRESLGGLLGGTTHGGVAEWTRGVSTGPHTWE